MKEISQLICYSWRQDIFSTITIYKFTGVQMKLTGIIALLLLSAGIISAQQESILKTAEDSISYSVGQSIGKNISDPQLKINYEVLFQGLKDQSEGKSLLTDSQIQTMMIRLNQKLIAMRNAKIDEQKVKNKKEAEEFLAENKNKEGVVTLPSGLQYKVLVKGDGPSPKENSVVRVHYKGTTIDGKVFDSSYDRGEPAEFELDRVIKGWTEALQLMHVGDKWMLYIPPELGYGEAGAGEVIEPNSLLIFEVELLDVK